MLASAWEFIFHFFVCVCVLNRFADTSPERASGSEMDEQRKQQMAYQYLCHLEEAKVYVEVLSWTRTARLKLLACLVTQPLGLY